MTTHDGTQERTLDPPEPREPSARACKDAADDFDACGDLPTDWIEDHLKTDMAIAFTKAALAHCSASYRNTTSQAITGRHLRLAYVDLRDAFVDEMAAAYES